jgi:cytochrome P450
MGDEPVLVLPGEPDGLPPYPVPRQDPLDVQAEYLKLVEQRPITAVRLPSGDLAWLVTGHDLARQALAHPALSADASRPGFPRLRERTRRIQLSGQTATGRAHMTLIQMDPPHHDALRRMLRGSFSHKRVREMTPALWRIADGLVAELRLSGPSADLIAGFALPFPALVICEILGVPAADREMFERETARIMSFSSSQRVAITALKVLIEYFGDLVDAAARSPGDDLTGRLIRDFYLTGELTRDDLISVVRLLLMAGLETTANMIGLCFARLLRDRSLYRLLCEQPELVPAAVEELVRFHVIAQHGMRRMALDDIRLGPAAIRTGDGVIICAAAANRDPGVFERPNELDFHRDARSHFSFSAGVHYCLGHILARAELEVALTAVPRAVPGLHLTAPFDGLRFRDDMVVYGVHELPVAWLPDERSSRPLRG